MRIPIHYRITFLFTAIVLVILFSVFVYLNVSLRENTYQNTRLNLQKQIAVAKVVLEERLADKSLAMDIADTFCDEIGKLLGVRITIIGPTGVVYGDSELNGQALRDVENHFMRPEVQEALESGYGESRRYSTTVKKDMLYVATTFGGAELKGFLRLSIPLSDIEALSGRLKQLLIVVFVFGFFGVFTASFAISSFISRPIHEMAHSAHAIARGDYSKKIPIVRGDEVGELATAFNYMIDQVRSRLEEVVANQSRLEAVLLSMFEAVMVVDSSGVILLLNKALKDVFRIKEDYQGKKPLELIRNIEIQEIIDKALLSCGGVITKEVVILTPVEKTLLMHAAPVIQKGSVQGAVLVMHDITELRRLERIRQDFVANVSHELRTPVTNIKGYAETLLEGALDDKKHAREFMKIIHSDAERLAQLIEDILDLSKIEAGKIPLAIEPLDLKAVLLPVVSGLEKQMQTKGIVLSLKLTEDLPRILADKNSMRQILLNLLDNAIKYNRPNGTITISASCSYDAVQVEVADSGIGIAEKDLSRIFERFYRTDKARSRELGGTGLGLSIVKHLLAAQGGTISVESTLGEGSIFRFSLPKAA